MLERGHGQLLAADPTMHPGSTGPARSRRMTIKAPQSVKP
jgi:hypothetical protein